MKYYSTENLPPVKFSHPGEKQIQVYDYVYNPETKQHDYLPVGKPIDWDAFIQSSKDSCDLENIIKRYEAGDANALNVQNTEYMDTLSFPTDLRGYSEFAGYLEQQFNSYDERFRKIFDDNYQTYVNDMLSGKAQEKIDNYNRSVIENTENNGGNS